MDIEYNYQQKLVWPELNYSGQNLNIYTADFCKEIGRKNQNIVVRHIL